MTEIKYVDYIYSCRACGRSFEKEVDETQLQAQEDICHRCAIDGSGERLNGDMKAVEHRAKELLKMIERACISSGTSRKDAVMKFIERNKNDARAKWMTELMGKGAKA